MNNEEALQELRMLKYDAVDIKADKEVLEKYGIAIDKGKEALEKAEKYKWHSLIDDPDDLPAEAVNYPNVENSSFSDDVLVMADRTPFPIVAYINLSLKLWHTPIDENIFDERNHGNIYAWRYIDEPFKEENE